MIKPKNFKLAKNFIYRKVYYLDFKNQIVASNSVVTVTQLHPSNL